MWNEDCFYEKILDGWERSETRSGIPYYVNHKTEKTQWDHPLFVKTMEELRELDNIQYAAYRTALKVRFIQKRLLLDLVSLPTIDNVFEKHAALSDNDTAITPSTLLPVLGDIFRLSQTTMKTSATNIINTETTAELLLNFLQNLYDPKKTGRMRVLSLKIGLITLCVARLSDKYKYIFRQLCDSNNQVCKTKMGAFIHNIVQIPEFVKETASFGCKNVVPAVDSCFSVAWSQGGISEEEFIRWLVMEPQTLVWLPTVHRLAAAETVRHEAKCSICKVSPIIGFRYRCLKCFNYDLCQDCFLRCRISKKHKLKHPVQEYCLATDTKEDTKAFMRTLRNNISKKHRNKRRLRYLPISASDDPHSPRQFMGDTPEPQIPLTERRAPNIRLLLTMPQVLNTKDPQSDVANGFKENENLLTPQSGLEEKVQLENIIHHLEDENREMLQEMEKLYAGARSSSGRSYSGSDTSAVDWLKEERERLAAKQDILEGHNQQLELQLQRLRLLLKTDGTNREPLAEIDGNVELPRTQGNSPETCEPFLESYNKSHKETPSSGANQLPIEDDTGSLSSFATPLRVVTCDTTMYNTPAGYSMNLSPGSLDQSLGQTYYSLPSPNQSKCFPDEEAELGELIDRLDKTYPPDLCQTDCHPSKAVIEEMFEAAKKIGEAFTDFVGNSKPKGREDIDGIETLGDDSETPSKLVLYSALSPQQSEA